MVTSEGRSRVWDLEAGAPVGKELELAEEEEVQIVTFSRDRQRMAATGFYDPRVRIWDVSRGRLIREIDAHSDVVQSIHEPEDLVHLLFAPGGDAVLTTSTYGAIRLWDLSTGRLVREFRGPGSEIAAAAFSADGRWLATGHYGVARLWDVSTGHLVQELLGHASFSEIESVAFSPDERYLLTSARDAVLRWPIPELPDSPQRLRSWVEVRSTVKWSDSGSLTPMGADEWLGQWARLTALGGPFEDLAASAAIRGRMEDH